MRKGGEPVFKEKLEFVIIAEKGTSIEETLAMVNTIKKAHPNAKIRVKVEA